MRSLLWLLGSVLALASCSSSTPRAVILSFSGRVGDAPFQCGMSYPNIGTTRSTFTALDFRFFVHDVRLLTSDGREVPLTITEDGEWQTHGVTLLDFEDGDGCEEGNAPVNFYVRGTVPGDGATYTGARLRIGVPPELDHLDADNQPSPLNVTSLFWGWADGYKFFRVDGRTTGQPSFIFHVGATGCSGDPRVGMRVCTNENNPEITLTNFDVEHDVIVADLAGLFSTSDLDHDGGGAAGCQADVDDPDCAAMFAAIGLGGTQTTFRVVHGGI